MMKGDHSPDPWVNRVLDKVKQDPYVNKLEEMLYEMFWDVESVLHREWADKMVAIGLDPYE